MSIIHNILSFIATFLVISTGTMLFVQFIVFLAGGAKQWEVSEKTNIRITCIGIAVAIALIPFYYLPL